jgi:hypothetical protein
MNNKIKNYIFTNCKSIFPAIGKGLFIAGDNLQLTSFSEDENKVVLKNVDLIGSKYRVELFIEFYLGKQKYKNPCFILDLDLKNERAEVISFESDLFPKIKLNVYTEVNNDIYKNVIAEQDLEMLCLNWLKQLNEYNYRPLCNMKIIA